MPDNIEDEVALALAIALSQKVKDQKRTHAPRDKHKGTWRRGLERKPHVAWTRTHGWKSTARHEGLRGR